MSESLSDEKLLRVLIVDDEEIVRKGLRNIIDWKKNKCTICGEAATAEEALEKIQQLKPALVLLDINMPGMSGIDLLAEVHNSPEKYTSKPSFLILSGYSDFDYAQKAINYGAKGYIVKPVDEDILEEKVTSIVNDIERETEADSLRFTAQQEELVKKFSQMLLFGAVEDGFEDNEEDNNKYQIALVSPELSGYTGQIVAIKSTVEENFSFTNHFSFFLEPTYVLVFKNEGEEAVVRYMGRFCAHLQKNKTGAIAALGIRGDGLEGALRSYRSARVLYKQLFFFTEKQFIVQADLDADKDAKLRLGKRPLDFNTQDFLTCIPDLVQYIEIYDLQKINTLLEAQQTWLHKSVLTVDEIKKLCMAFIVETQNALQAKHPEKQFDTVPALDLVNLIYTQNYFDEMLKIVTDFTAGLAESFTSNTTNSTILKVIQYVKTNYNTDLKLEMLGDLFNCNSAYLGKKFREYTGVPFNTYLDIIRIEAAKNMLLQSDLKIYEISKLVGYSNTDYFYLKFKRHTNMTPKEFKSATCSEAPHGQEQNGGK
jgi:two-component system response regulator YesN